MQTTDSDPGPAPADGIGLPALEARLAEDLAHLNLPAANWVPATTGPEDEPVIDAVIVGGGMCGMLAWFALQRAGIRNARIIDRNPEGFEGPWLTYARMETLRSPKQLTGPAMGLGPLTFQAWFRARFGAAEWEAMDRIPRPMWMDYLRWYRRVLGVPIENGVGLTRVRPEGGLLRLELDGAAPVRTRKLVMATGREGTGHPNLPGFVEGVARRFWAHSSDDIDFPALKGKRVAVVGVGASAVDNAAEALEAGAAEVRHLVRRAEMPTINKLMGIGSYGFTAGFAALPDEWKWRVMNYSFITQTPPPRGSTLRVSRHENAHFHFKTAVSDVRQTGEALRVDLADGSGLDTDFLILGTGFTTDPMARTEFGEDAGRIALWRDVFTPPAGEENTELGLFPYLGEDFTFRERVAGEAPWLSGIYCFNYGATASLGKVSGDIPGVSDGAAWLARAMAATLYREDIEAHWAALEAYDKPELLGDEWLPADLPHERARGVA